MPERRTIITAAEMDAMTPQERADAVVAGTVTSWDDDLDLLLPPERGSRRISLSVTDFHVFDLPAVRDELARDLEARTLPTDDPDVRV